MEDNQRIDELINSFMSGEIYDEDFSRLQAWSRESEENRLYVRERIELLFSSSVLKDSAVVDENKAYRKFLKKVHVSQETERRHSMIRKHIMWIAAAVIIFAVMFSVSFNLGKRSVNMTFSNIVVEASLGTSTRLSLPDGSKVWLNAGSKISYSQGFGVKDRNIDLVGEGYFEVMHNPDMPFIVRTNEISLRVTGTKFDFKNYPDDEEASISLLDGSLSVRNELRNMPEVYLHPNEMVVLDKDSGSMGVNRGSVEYSNVWKDNKLFFDEETIAEIAKRLGRSYGVNIEVSDSLKQHRFYGDFTITKDPIEKVFDIISTTCRMHYREENGKYFLY